MKVLLSGSTGLVGSEVFKRLYINKDSITRLVRSVADSAGTDIVWDPAKPIQDVQRYEGFDAVIHLAGDSIATGRWTASKKKRIKDSRVLGTGHLAIALGSLKNPPKVFVCASAIGYYGNRGEEAVDETSKPGAGFLPEVCQAWEAATEFAKTKGIRTVNLRFGIILSPNGGALKAMLPPFKIGVGGNMGDGRQYMSWVALKDVVSAVLEAVTNPKFEGPINVVAPEPVTNAVFTQTLGDVLKRPTLLPMPAFAAKLVFGEMADALLLSSTRVSSKKLEGLGFKFAHPKLGEALTSLLKR